LQPPGLIEIDQAPLLPWEGDYANFLDRHLLSVDPALIGAIEVSGAGVESFAVRKTAGGPGGSPARAARPSRRTKY